MTYPKPIVRTVIGNGAFVLGRGATANIRLQDASVSRDHARLTFGGEHVQVEDLGSANGTRIVTVVGDAGANEVALRPQLPVQVPENATLHLGSVVVLVRRVQRTQEASPTGLVAQSQAMQELLQIVDRIAGSRLHVVLTGEAGVGRDTIARTLHERSLRASQPFVAYALANRAPAIVERELFGVEHGAASSAGLLEAGGTLMLDAIDTLSAPLQNELLRALTSRAVTRKGGRKSIPIDVRLVVGASAEDAFTRSLCRLGGVTLAVPPLLLRRDDIEPLAEAFVARAAQALGRAAPPIDEEARHVLSLYHYPNNVRELAEIMTRAVPLAGAGAIVPAHLLILSEDGPRELADESEATVVRARPTLK